MSVLHGDEDGEAPGAWIFVSHSNKDLGTVRTVRNALEARGHNPLLFFLKCMGDDAELDGLIRREIEARTWFLLCDSENARASRRVQDEVAIIKSLPGKVHEVVDLCSDLDDQIEHVERLSRRATVFLSHSRSDRALADQLRTSLQARDFAVWDPQVELGPGSVWEDRMQSDVENAMARGLYVILLSPNALASEWVNRELDTALKVEAQHGKTGRILPVLIGPGFEWLPKSIQDRQALTLTDDQFDSGVDELVRVLKSIEPW